MLCGLHERKHAQHLGAHLAPGLVNRASGEARREARGTRHSKAPGETRGWALKGKELTGCGCGYGCAARVCGKCPPQIGGVCAPLQGLYSAEVANSPQGGIRLVEMFCPHSVFFLKREISVRKLHIRIQISDFLAESEELVTPDPHPVRAAAS